MSAPDPLPQAYSHRDCELTPPLEMSLRYGFTHIEADVYCLLGRVFVAHDRVQLRPWRTLQALYLEPLRRHVRANGGRVFSDDTPLYLFVDVKTPAEPAFWALEHLLARYGDLVTTFTPDRTEQKPVTVVVSGNRLSYRELAALPLRHSVLDGRLPDLSVNTDPHVMPFISDHWDKAFRWRGTGEMPAEERARLAAMLEGVHTTGQRLRFWATPDTPGPERLAVWDTLLTLGVDLINTDDVAGLNAYFRHRAGDEPLTSTG